MVRVEMALEIEVPVSKKACQKTDFFQIKFANGTTEQLQLKQKTYLASDNR